MIRATNKTRLGLGLLVFSNTDTMMDDITMLLSLDVISILPCAPWLLAIVQKK